MTNKDQIGIDQQQLVEAWQRTLPTTIKEGDRATVQADEADPKAIRITIEAAGHTMYSFDFKVTYVDSREVRTELVDAERDDRSIDERGAIPQQLVQDYTRHIHECAQALHGLTHA
ncbi:hypothetical protein FHS18_005893 [Paenibacillus phyllosphaerae]|uniref:Uncharacterized protein n=1 Tax=Paenibacillus phyllosphaerae TaxID=274593 RepID=A0A7W5B3J5_9BACL|nr:hypothetical protein [Paenibacillus phyllosphaerae]MBB3113780.1 hypothetical protein [Paenibacillus phyllosphaerae]